MKVNWDDEIPNSHGKIKLMFQTTNQMFVSMLVQPPWKKGIATSTKWFCTPHAADVVPCHSWNLLTLPLRKKHIPWFSAPGSPEPLRKGTNPYKTTDHSFDFPFFQSYFIIFPSATPSLFEAICYPHQKSHLLSP